MGIVTVIVTGLPVSVTVANFTQKLEKIFDTKDIDKYRVRELSYKVSKKRQIAIDFESSFDAMEAQELIHKYKYRENGIPHTLRAKIERENRKSLRSDTDHSDEDGNKKTWADSRETSSREKSKRVTPSRQYRTRGSPAKSRSRSRQRDYRDMYRPHSSDASTSRSKTVKSESKHRSNRRSDPSHRDHVAYLKRELSSLVKPPDSGEKSFSQPGPSGVNDLRTLIMQKRKCYDLSQVKDIATQDIMLKQNAYLQEISQVYHITLLDEDKKLIMEHLYGKVKERINKLKIYPKPNILVNDVITLYERQFNENDDKKFIRALLRELSVPEINKDFEQQLDTTTRNKEQEVNAVPRDIAVDTVHEEKSKICKNEISDYQESVNKMVEKCNELEITQEQVNTVNTTYPHNLWTVAENSKYYNIIIKKSMKRKKNSNSQPSGPRPCVKKFDIANKKICSMPKFVITVNNLLKNMKSIINSKYDGKMKGNKFLGIIKIQLRKKIRELLAGKSYMTSRDITTLFRHHNPKYQDETFINHIVRHIKYGKYDDFVPSDEEVSNIDESNIKKEPEDKTSNAKLLIKSSKSLVCEKILDTDVVIKQEPEPSNYNTDIKIKKESSPTEVLPSDCNTDIQSKKESSPNEVLPSDCNTDIQSKKESSPTEVLPSDCNTDIQSKKESSPTEVLPSDCNTDIQIKKELEPNVEIKKELESDVETKKKCSTEVLFIKTENAPVKVEEAETELELET